MANLKEIRTRITSVASTMQITSAMKMVSAAKLKRAQDAITQMRPYAEKLREILVNISSTLEGSAEGVYSQEREVNKVLIVAIASNRGLCGAFNANIFKAAEKRIKECAEKLGSQCVIVEIHAKRKQPNNWEVFIENGRQPTNLNVLDWVEEAQKLGAGEILVVSVDNDGVCKGPDLELTTKLEQACKVPFIYAGGTSQRKDFLEMFNLSGVDGLALSHLIHFNKDNIKNIKSFLKLNNIDIRI